MAVEHCPAKVCHAIQRGRRFLKNRNALLDFRLRWLPSVGLQLNSLESLIKVPTFAFEQFMQWLEHSNAGCLMGELAVNHHQGLPHGRRKVPEVTQSGSPGLPEDTKEMIGCCGGSHSE